MMCLLLIFDLFVRLPVTVVAAKIIVVVTKHTSHYFTLDIYDLFTIYEASTTYNLYEGLF